MSTEIALIMFIISLVCHYSASA